MDDRKRTYSESQQGFDQRQRLSLFKGPAHSHVGSLFNSFLPAQFEESQ